MDTDNRPMGIVLSRRDALVAVSGAALLAVCIPLAGAMVGIWRCDAAGV